ncbi:endonuclease/exonuclease/phosphatase family protein [Coprobacter tertius]|uniref:Endonuclease/exonuclease/phosphatase family protein n=1 Tax=Coprobacter tertius TaxID=2944915 RepID=A0ABT1MI30_9BACT|nr:endonuclease/exonuclease/phosphatase family protein [Coprobacter tertius]MCP9612285.1 endonuclease/exonuclease/phosphatase family protein [Coprobacter tertius]
MKKIIPLLILLSIYSFLYNLNARNTQSDTISVFQMNLWHGGTKVPNGYECILNVLDEVNADIVLLCEIRHPFMHKIIGDLAERGKYYHGETLGLSVGLLTKIIPDSIVKRCIVPGDESRAMLKTTVTIKGQPISIYSCHLDYRNYECYLPRGYSGTTWKKIDHPVTDENTVLKANRLSFRDESISAFLKDAQKEIKKGRAVIIGGDFNEPSLLDWQENTKNLWDHNGAVIRWDCSAMLLDAGFKDSYREKYPDAVTYPGFTFPAGNREAEKADLENLAWAPEADERDRIDFIYYYSPDSVLSLLKSTLVGPSGTVLRGKIIPADTKDNIYIPKSVWPSDHKGNLTTFKVSSR